MSYVSAPKPVVGLGERDSAPQETSIKIVKASMSISDDFDHKGETKSSDTELLFIVPVLTQSTVVMLN